MSSGAIALGRHALKLPKGALELEQSQAAAAVGQISLAHAYQELAARPRPRRGADPVTLGDTEERRRYLNARNTIETLLALKAIPVVNENDTVATTEIRYGDNDRLSARVASMVSADCLVLLSDIDGLYTAPPDGKIRTPSVSTSSPPSRPRSRRWRATPAPSLSKGGMKTKIEAAKIALGAGTHMVITSGKVQNPLRAIADGAPCTWFLAHSDPLTAKKRWISGQLDPEGPRLRRCRRREGAGCGQEPAAGRRDARRGRIRPRRRRDYPLCRRARARSRPHRLCDGDAERIIGRKSSEIAAILGVSRCDELIHRDDMALNRI